MRASVSSGSDGMPSQTETGQAASTPETSPSLMDDEPVRPNTMGESVIVGMACRLPGAKTPEQLWKNIVEQKDLQRKIPKDRFNIDAYYHPEGTHKGTMNARYGYFLDDDIREFDPEFFQISGKEAEAMDPQQRMLLEVVYEALENAGITLQDVSGTNTSVYCGCFTNDYREMTYKDIECYPKYCATGTGMAILSNRISYFYNLHGPSVTIDTACSSSLVGLHLGNNSIRNGESDISIIVGSALHFDPTIFTTMTDLGFLSTDGRCRAFDVDGKGYVRGEGICAVVLKNKSKALHDGDSIRALVRGTACNHDGTKEGITMPNSAAQEALIRTVYKNAGLSTHETSYFEAHGTGTQAGDPRETRAIGSVFAPNRDRPLYVGSIKTNIGHLEGASGLAGIIKTAMSLEAGVILPNMHFNTPNPNIDFKAWKISVPTATIPWEPVNGIRRASVNSFGYGGTNAHIILEQYLESHSNPETISLPTEFEAMTMDRPMLLPLSTHTEKAGKLLKTTLSSLTEDSPKITTADLASSLSSTRRTQHRYRSYAISTNTATIKETLEEDVVSWKTILNRKPRIGFVFTGQGAQWYAMGRELFEKSPMFRQLLAKCEAVLKTLENPPTWSIMEELSRNKEDTNVNHLAYASALSPSLQICMVELLKAWGITPSAVCGHSAGEIGASYAAGIISFEDALACAWYRGTAFNNYDPPDRVKVPGAMIAVGMSEAEAEAELEKYNGHLCIAAINSPSSLTISGDMPQCLEFKKSLEDRKVFVRRLAIPQAYHSHHMVPHASELLRLTKHVKGRPATCRMFSSVTGRLAKGEEMGGQYFCDNLVSAVRFSDALTGTVLDESEEQIVDVLLEIGAHPALKGPSRQTLQSLKIDLPYLGTITRDRPDFSSLLECAGQLYALGYPVNLEAVNSNLFLDQYGSVQQAPAGHIVKLPTYSWDHGKYWFETRYVNNYRKRKERHAFLGAQTYGDVDKHPRWRVFLRTSELPWLMHHMIDGKVIFPAAGYLSMAIEAAVRFEDSPETMKSVTIHDVNIKSALTVSETEMGTEAILEMQPLPVSAKRVSDTECRFTISSYTDNGVVSEHCSGIVSVQKGETSAIEPDDLARSFTKLQKLTNQTTDVKKCYQFWQDIGLGYGQSFQLLDGTVDSGSGVAMSQITLNSKNQEIADHEHSIIHPTFLDASFHPFFASIESLTGRPLDGPWVPTFIKSVKVSGEFAARSASKQEHNLWTTTETELPGPRTAVINVKVRSADGQDILVDVKGLEATTLGSSREDDKYRSLFFRTRWQPLFGELEGTETLAKTTDMDNLIDIFAHQHPDSKILHITPSLDVTKGVLSSLMRGQRRRFATLTVAASSGVEDEALESFESHYAGLVNHSEPTPSGYDLVVVSRPQDMDIRALLCPGGFAIAHPDAYTGQGLEQLFGNDHLTVWGTNVDVSEDETDLTIIMSDTPSDRVRKLYSTFEEQNKGRVQKITLADVVQSSIDTTNILVLASLDKNLLLEPDDNEVADFEAVRSLMTMSGNSIVWVIQGATMESSDPAQALINGMARSARNENDKLKLMTLDVSKDAKTAEIVKSVNHIFKSPMEEDEIVLRHGTLFVPRIEADDALNSKLPENARNEAQREPFGQSKPLSLKIGKVGLLETLAFSLDEEIIDTELAEDEIEIEVKASAINFRDVAASMGIIDDYRLGDECAGIVLRVGSQVPPNHFEAGDHVVAFRPGQGAHRTMVRNHWSQCHKLNGISMAHAAALPLVTTTAYYALVDLARLQKGETVLIHAAAGGVGQMAIQLAQMLGAEVIATCGSQTKRELLKSAYGLMDDHIFSSRDLSFAKDVMKLTKGKGVDVVLNSLAGELLHATWNCIARFGRFIEIGKRDIHENAKIEMDPFRKNVLFASAEMITIWEHNKPLSQRLLQDAFRLLEAGKIRNPETILELPYSEVEKGFRLLQMGKHTGKVVLVPHKTDLVPVSQPTYRQKDLFEPTKTYLLVGGLGGLGRTLSQWMVRKGARRLAFMSRSGEARPEAQATVSWLKARDIEVTVFPVDVTNSEQVQTCIEDLGDTLAGIFHAAVVLQDVPLNAMTPQQWRSCLDPKVRGAWNLHQATQNSDLDFFVTFSSLSCQLGGAGQANYSAANAFLDALMRSRRHAGLRGTTMNVGAITGAGLVAENEALMRFLTFMGYDMVNEEELLYQIEEAVVQSRHSISDDRGVDMVGTITGVNMKKKDYYWHARSFFRNLYSNHDLDSSSSAGAKVSNSLSAQLKAATNLEERAAILTLAFIEKTAAVLGADVATIQSTNPLSMYGLDSIVAVEFRKWFSKTINVDVALFDILSSPSIDTLVAKAASLMIVVDDASPKVDESPSKKTANTGVQAVAGIPSSADPSVLDEIAVQRPEHLPMSNFQRRLWFAHQMAEDKAALNIAIAAYMKGTPDFEIFKSAMDEWKKRNEITRTLYLEGDDFPEQLPIEDYDSRMEYEDLSSERDSERAVNEVVKRLRDEPMDIENGEIFRAVLVKLADDYFAFVTAWHHIAIDRGSSKASFEQIVSIYDALRLGKDLATVPVPSLSYIDFAVWYERYLNSDAIQSEATFWMDKLRGMNPQTKLLSFAKEARSDVLDLARNTILLTLPLKMLNRLKRVCARMAATPFQFLLAAFRAFMYRYTDEKDLTMLIIDGNRPRSDLDDVMGFYVNMVPVRINSDLEEGFDQLLKTTKKASVEALEHNKMPFDVIVERLNFPRTSSTFPISQVVMNYQMHGKMPRFVSKDFEINRVVNYDIPSACEIAVEALEDPDRGMDLFLQYSTRLYDDANMERFWDNFVTFLTSLTQDHMQPIDQVKIAGLKETEHLKNDFWNMDTTRNKWESVSILDRIYMMAEKSPTSIAILTSEDSLSYKDLAEQAQRVAASLKRTGVTPGTSIGILAQPGIEAIVAMVGALSHGCGYLALDPDFAAQRLGFMASDSAISALLIGDGLEAIASQMITETESIAKVMKIAEASSGEEMSRYANASLDNPFYTIYTSGSTGKPKGVVLTYANTHQMLATLHNDYAFTAADRFLHQSSMCFDLSIVQIFSALTAGATVCVATADARRDPSILASFILQASVSVTYFTPTHFSLLLDSSSDVLKQCKNYRVAFFAGERLPIRLVNRFCELQIPATILNTWSPSELVVQTTIAEVTGIQSEQVNIPIGRPIANCRHYIVDSQLNPLPFGFIGEICVGGAQVGAGYLNRPDANTASFVEDPFCSDVDKYRGWNRLFRTGDKGKFLRDGQLEFHGRIAGDKQIKLRGFRVDLGEVEHRIYIEASTIPTTQVTDVSLVARAVENTQSETDERQVIAFLVVKQTLEPEARNVFVTELHQRISKHLNSYMLPNGYEFLDQMPLTVGRKIDRQSLLKRDLHLVRPNATQRQPTDEPSVSEAQQNILDLVIKHFHEVLRLPAEQTVAAHDNFFELGGQSILFLRLHARLKRALKAIPGVPELFKAPTPLLMSRTISNWSLTSSTGSNTLADRMSHVNWVKEAMLPDDARYMPGNVSPVRNNSEVTAVLVTGLESIIGIHVFAALIASHPETAFHVLGEDGPWEMHRLIKTLTGFKLLDDHLTEDMLHTSVHFVQGGLMRPHFGLAHAAFKSLGNTVQGIYHLGGRVSLLKSYAELKRANVNAILDLIELASYGHLQTTINALSTWSVPHLQSHRKTKLAGTHLDKTETSAAQYQPSADAELFYFKSRWVAERLLTRAAERGFSVNVFRASAVSRNTTTNVPPPQEDLVKQMISEMINSAAVPDFRSGANSMSKTPHFVIDFVPVDYVAQAVVDISTSKELRKRKRVADKTQKDVAVYHICNPSPLPLHQLPTLMPQIRSDKQRGEVKTLDGWLSFMKERAVTDEQKLRVEAAKAICETGHIMFALDNEQTREALEIARRDAGRGERADRVAAVECPPIDVDFLKNLSGQ